MRSYCVHDLLRAIVGLDGQEVGLGGQTDRQGRLPPVPHLKSEVVQQARSFGEHPWFLHDLEKGGRAEWLEVFIDYWNKPGSWARASAPVTVSMRSFGKALRRPAAT